jgi:DNA replication protein DnaC
MSPARPDATPAVKPIEVTPELKALMRRLKLGQLLDTLPERLALARSNRLPHHDFLEMLLADEVTRRDRQSAARRAKAAHLDPQMQLHAWDDTAAVTYDRQLWAELTSLRFLADAYNVLVMGPVGVGKTFLAHALGHIAIRRHHSVHTERADKLFKRLRGARLDGSYEDEMRKLHRVELLIIDLSRPRDYPDRGSVLWGIGCGAGLLAASSGVNVGVFHRLSRKASRLSGGR